jgi:hypothetical protein
VPTSRGVLERDGALNRRSRSSTLLPRNRRDLHTACAHFASSRFTVTDRTPDWKLLQ